MKLIEIRQRDNGGHDAQLGNDILPPPGWAIVPDALATENFPFGEIVVETVNGVPTVTSWTPLPIPPAEDEGEEEEENGA